MQQPKLKISVEGPMIASLYLLSPKISGGRQWFLAFLIRNYLYYFPYFYWEVSDKNLEFRIYKEKQLLLLLLLLFLILFYYYYYYYYYWGIF
jgi:hypothetical protein